jgi:hypothetical protein
MRRTVFVMRLALPLFLLALALPLQAKILLAGEPVQIDAAQKVRFTDRQVKSTAVATRAGLDRWARTEQGRWLLRYFAARNLEIVVTEDASEPGSGRAPQPGVATLLASEKMVKVYELIINPAPADVPKMMTTFAGHPSKTEDFIAATWAAEMLHIYFYTKGVLLPHHGREDFQNAWLAVASQLGFPTLQHGAEETSIAVERKELIVIGEEEPTQH